MTTLPELPALHIAVDTVAEACVVARHVQRHLDHIREITKDDRSPVTVADFAVQALIALRLRERLGTMLLVGEEHAAELRTDAHAAVRDAVTDAVRLVLPDVTTDDVLDAIDAGDHDGTAADYWTLDPVDGTKGFLRGQQYAIALGFIERRNVTLGVMGCPNLPASHHAPLDRADDAGTIYCAARGHGAYELAPGRADGTVRAIHAAPENAAAAFRICESVEAAHSRQDDSARIVSHLGGAATPVRLDSQCKYAVVARNQADAYLRLPTSATYVEKIWDHAAGSCIALEAGARVTDITGAALDFSTGRRLEHNRGIICASAGLHGRIIDAIDALNIGATA
ncbi:MAG: 3'(2'),5'-bisphosphate nucleotidase [Phycisphaerales bacterium]|nr:3'(2'),5'-bisphosphate nucleotidase [Phycisphaerales bacterium]